VWQDRLLQKMDIATHHPMSGVAGQAITNIGYCHTPPYVRCGRSGYYKHWILPHPTKYKYKILDIATPHRMLGVAGQSITHIRYCQTQPHVKAGRSGYYKYWILPHKTPGQVWQVRLLQTLDIATQHAMPGVAGQAFTNIGYCHTTPHVRGGSQAITKYWLFQTPPVL
jgi:hypothetical protein